MKALFTIILAVLMALTVAQATPPGSGEDEADGWLEDGVYTNRVYSFDFKVPEGWHAATEENLGAYTAELNKGGGKSDARAFLMLSRPAQATGDIPDIIIIAGAKSGMLAGVSRTAAMAYFRAQKRSKNIELLRPASPFLLGGLLVAREDAHAKSLDGHEQYMANMIIGVRDRLISFQAYGATQSRMEEAVNAIVGATEFQPDWVARSASGNDAAPSPQERVRISQDTLMALLDKKVAPELPDSMSETPVNVTIDMHLLVSAEGTVEKIWVFEGPPQLAWPAVQAVSKWKFRPYLLNGKPLPVESTVTVSFQ